MARSVQVPPAVSALARSWNDLDPDALMPWLDSDVRYQIPATDTVLVGPPEVRAYMERKVEGIEAVGEDALVHARPGWLEVAGDRRWVVILGQGDLERSAVCRVEAGPDGRIREITVSVDAADRESAIEVEVGRTPVDPDREAR